MSKIFMRVKSSVIKSYICFKYSTKGSQSAQIFPALNLLLLIFMSNWTSAYISRENRRLEISYRHGETVRMFRACTVTAVWLITVLLLSSWKWQLASQLHWSYCFSLTAESVRWDQSHSTVISSRPFLRPHTFKSDPCEINTFTITQN